MIGRMSVDIERGARTPVYQQIGDRLREAIAAGDYPPGSRLPSEAALARDYAVARGTARNVHRYLERLGVAEVEPGRGAFVVEARP